MCLQQANTLLNHSFDFPTFIRHGSDRNLFHSLPDDQVTLGVAVYDQSTDHMLNTSRSNHPFKNMLMLQYFDSPTVKENLTAPGGNVLLTRQSARQEPHMHLCEVAELVSTPWFALTDNYHVINAPAPGLWFGRPFPKIGGWILLEFARSNVAVLALAPRSPC